MSANTQGEATAGPDPVCLYAQWRAQHPGRGVPARLVTDSGFALGTWVRRMRAARFAGTLPDNRIQQLDAVGFTWSGDEDRHLGQQWRSEARWRELLTELDHYRAEHGDAIVPSKYVAPSGNRLGEWLARQQRTWRSGCLSEQRRQDLQQRGIHPTRQQSLHAALDASPTLAVHTPAARHPA